MEVRSDKSWQEQRSLFKQTLPEGLFERYFELVQRIADDSEFAINSKDMKVGEAVREAIREVGVREGFLTVDAMKSILLLLIRHWVHGEELSRQLTPIEEILIYDILADYLEERQNEAASQE